MAMKEPQTRTCDVLTPREVATLLRVDVRTVKSWLAAGKLTGFRTPGGHWRVTDAQLLTRWNEAHGESGVR